MHSIVLLFSPVSLNLSPGRVSSEAETLLYDRNTFSFPCCWISKIPELVGELCKTWCSHAAPLQCAWKWLPSEKWEDPPLGWLMIICFVGGRKKSQMISMISSSSMGFSCWSSTCFRADKEWKDGSIAFVMLLIHWQGASKPFLQKRDVCDLVPRQRISVQ